MKGIEGDSSPEPLKHGKISISYGLSSAQLVK